MDPEQFVVADYAGDIVDSKLMSGYMVKLGDALFVWGEKQQTTVSLSTCECEYYAMTLAV